MAELLNCPFCGGKAVMDHGPGVWREHYRAHCDTAVCMANPVTQRSFGTAEQAAEFWNRRAPSSPSIEREVSGEGGEKAAAWEVEVHYSNGKRTLRAGMKWRDGITGSIWEVIEPGSGRIYSPSGFGGTPTFWCKPVEKTEAAQPWLKDARADGCVSFCGDSIAAGLIDSACVTPCDGGKNV